MKTNPALAALLNVAGPGLGFLYLGRPRWALGTLTALPLLFALAAWTRLIFTPIGFAATGLDNSYDSRSWGPLPQAYLHGSVEFIWFSFHWPDGLRAGRLGSWPK
jgi:hypothetical protein